MRLSPPRLRGSALRAMAILVLQLAVVRHWRANAQVGDVQLCGAQDGSSLLGPKPSWDEVSKLLMDANVLNTQFSSKHVVALSPTVPYDKGGIVAARAFAKLPREGAMTTKLTKVVLVGHVYGAGGGNGILIGADVCNSDLVDSKAVTWLKKTIPTTLGKPMVLDKAQCSESINPSLEQALPFLSAVWFKEDNDHPGTALRSLKANVLPIMVQQQSFDMAAQVGDALAKLVESDGVYEDERVLFVFGADLSHNLAKDTALAMDKTTVDKILGTGFGPLATYVKDLQKHDVEDSSGDPLKRKTQAPFGYVNILAASRLSGNLGMQAQLMNRACSGDYEGNTATNGLDPVRGYGSVVFIKDTRPIAQQMGSGPEERAFPTTKTTTTTFTTTLMEVAPAAANGAPGDPRMAGLFLQRRQRRPRPGRKVNRYVTMLGNSSHI